MTEEEFQGHIKAIEDEFRAGNIQESDEGEPYTSCFCGAVLIGEGSLKYRLKPKPIERWVCSFPDGEIGDVLWESKEKALEGKPDGVTAVRMVQADD